MSTDPPLQSFFKFVIKINSSYCKFDDGACNVYHNTHSQLSTDYTGKSVC